MRVLFRSGGGEGRRRCLRRRNRRSVRSLHCAARECDGRPHTGDEWRTRVAGGSDYDPWGLLSSMGGLAPKGIWGSREDAKTRSEENLSELKSLMRISYDVFCLNTNKHTHPIPDLHAKYTLPI